MGSITTSTAGSMQDMQKIINHLILFPAVHLFPLPAGDSPFLAIKIDREQGGVKYGYDSAVSKQEQNLVVSGPPAEDIGFLGSATYQQPAFPHVPPFLAFNNNLYPKN